jgi:hypothetical protein
MPRASDCLKRVFFKMVDSGNHRPGRVVVESGTSSST